MSDELPEDLTREPESGLARMIYRLREQGPIWIVRRILSEWVLPTTKLGKALHAALRSMLTAGLLPVRVVRRTFVGALRAEWDTLYAFYDLKVQQITFDVLWFLTGADLERRRQSLKRVHVVVVPGPVEGLREEEP